jgi:hypothetical protein
MKLFKRNTTVTHGLHSSSEIKGEFFIKSIQPSPEYNTGHSDNLQKEGEELQRCMQQSIRTQHVLPVEFVSYDKDTNCLSTKFFPKGTSLFNMMWNSSSIINRIRKRSLSPDLLASRCEEIGKWLALYHNSTFYPQSKEQAMESLKNSFKEKIEGTRQNRLVKENFLQKVEKRFFPEIEKLANNSYLQKHHIKICKIHADFSPVNMLSNDTWNIRILDFAEVRIGTSFEDVGRFYESLYAIAQTSNYRKKIFSKAMASFIRGYGFSQDIQEDPFFLTVRAYNGILNCYAGFVQRKHLSFASNLAAYRMINASLNWLSRKLSTPYR